MMYINKNLNTNMFLARTANEWMREAVLRKDPVSLWHDLWFEDELCCLFADTNVGKSIYAVQIAAHIAESRRVLYFDFEMSDKQFQLRYTNPADGKLHRFPDAFIRLEFNNDSTMIQTLPNIISSIEDEVKRNNATVIIIDNITWLCNNCESGDAAGELMQLLVGLKKRLNLSILVLAHTPKRNIASPLTQNSLAGSKRLANFMDSIFAIGLTKDARPNGRYIKQIKVRNCEVRYGADNVITALLGKCRGNLIIEHVGNTKESDLLAVESPSASRSREEVHEEIKTRLLSGESYAKIATEMRVSTKTISTVNQSLRA